MPLYFRKSVRLGAGVRMNLSGSGVGFSFGTRGCRVSTGPRGTYVNIGTGGVHYRQKIGGPYSRSSSPPVQPVAPFQTGTPIPNAHAEQLAEGTSAATLAQLNAAIRQPSYAWIFAVVGLIIAVALGNIATVLFPLVLGFALFLAYLANQFDKERRIYNLEFHLDEAARQRWIALNTAFASLAKTQALWRVITQDYTYDWKRNAGANSLLSRVRATLAQRPAAYITSNLTPYCLNIGVQQLFFFPDRVYVYQNRVYGAVEYDNLSVDSGQTNFIESDPTPSDAQIVGSTWQYVNKDGSPDRRFNYNRQLPIANYGVVELKSGTGLNVLMHVSSLSVAHQFHLLYKNSLFASRPTTSHSSTNQKARGQYPPYSNQQSRQTPPPQHHKPPLPDCYKILGLTPNCTKEEAAAKYHQLAASYHPDRVNNLAPEFKILAQQKMTEINLAYADLKRLHSW